MADPEQLGKFPLMFGLVPLGAQIQGSIGRLSRRLSFWNVLAATQIAEGWTGLESPWKSRFVG